MRAILCLLIILSSALSQAQSARDYSVALSATVDTVTPSITIHWPSDPSASSYLLSRKKVTDATWTTLLGMQPGTATQYVDTQIQPGESYEYKVQKIASGFNAYGYILAGASDKPTASWGRALLVIDTTHYATLQSRIDRFVDDLWREGWLVERILVDRQDSVPAVKQRIQQAYQADPQRTSAVILLGHVPVPYSGNIAPDGHTNNHLGAWPADVYYGDMDGVWTDAMVNVTNMPSRTNNVPGDGKFDQSIPPSSVELMVGRIDMALLPAFNASEEQLLARYLDKNHAYRTGQWDIRHRAVIDDNFGGFNGEAFASNGWRNFAPLLGIDSVTTGDYRSAMDTGTYLWSYGCGGGSYRSANGIGNTTQLASDSLQGVFTMLFGSYFGDWDVQDNFLRAPLAQGNILTNAWAGRPHWSFHHMAQGYPIGYAARLAQNNSNTYWVVFGARQVHTALMGDPTLRMWPMAQVEGLAISRLGRHVSLTWQNHPSATTYHVYVWNPTDQTWEELGTTPTTTYIDSCRLYKRTLRYAVRASKMQATPSGSFRNLSPMDTASIQIDNRFLDIDFTFQVRYDTLFYADSTVEAEHFSIDFGNGLSDTARAGTHSYYTGGNKIITVKYANECQTDSITFPITITFPAGDLGIHPPSLLAAPNPFSNNLRLTSTSPWQSLEIRNAMGQPIFRTAEGTQVMVPTSSWPAGWYVVLMTNKKGQRFRYPVCKL